MEGGPSNWGVLAGEKRGVGWRGEKAVSGEQEGREEKAEKGVCLGGVGAVSWEWGVGGSFQHCVMVSGRF